MQLLSICALAEWKGMHWTPPHAPCMELLSHVCNCLPQSHPVLLQNKHCVHNIICPFVRDFPLQVLIRPPPDASLFSLGLGLNNPWNAECARSIFTSMSEWITSSPWWMGKLRCEVRLLQSHTFASQSHWFIQGVSLGCLNNPSVSSDTQEISFKFRLECL